MAQITITTTADQDRALTILATEVGLTLTALIQQRAMQGVSAAVTYVLDRERQKAKEAYVEFAIRATPEELAAVEAIIKAEKPPK